MTNLKTLTVAAVTALGLTITPMPAAADTSDVAKVLGGLAALAIAAKVIDDRRDRRSERAEQAKQLSVINNRNNAAGNLRRLDRGNVNTRSARIKQRPLPDRCLRVANTRRGDRLVYGQRCLNNNFQFASRLPDHCETAIRTNRGVRTVFGARCLSRDGWRVTTR